MVKTSPLSERSCDTDALRVVVIDRHELLTRGLRLLLDQEHDIDVVAESGDGMAAVRLVAECRPDVALVDSYMPPWDTADARRRIKAMVPHLRIVVLTGDTEPPPATIPALPAGADGQVRRDSSIDDVVGAIRQVVSSAAA